MEPNIPHSNYMFNSFRVGLNVSGDKKSNSTESSSKSSKADGYILDEAGLQEVEKKITEKRTQQMEKRTAPDFLKNLDDDPLPQIPYAEIAKLMSEYAKEKKENTVQSHNERVIANSEQKMATYALKESLKPVEVKTTAAVDPLKEKRETALKRVKKDPSHMKKVSDELKNDKEFMKQVVNIDPSAFKYASPQLRNDSDVVTKAIGAHCLKRYDIEKTSGYPNNKVTRKYMEERELILSTIGEGYKNAKASMGEELNKSYINLMLDLTVEQQLRYGTKINKM